MCISIIFVNAGERMCCEPSQRPVKVSVDLFEIHFRTNLDPLGTVLQRLNRKDCL